MRKIYKNNSSIQISTDCEKAFQKSKHCNYETGKRSRGGYYVQVKNGTRK